MWSDRYNYYNIQFDEKYSQSIKKEIAVKALLETKLFIQKNHQSFRNSEAFPWVEIILTDTRNGNFSASDNEILFVTLISIVCSKGLDIDQQIYIDTFIHIAVTLNWKLYLDADDDGNENIEIKKFLKK